MLFRTADLEAIIAGTRRLAFRRWKRPSAKAGTAVRTQLGLVGIDSIENVDPAAITEAEAIAAGFADLPALHRMLGTGEGACYRIALHYAGADTTPRSGDDAELSPADRDRIAKRLAALDARRSDCPWTAATLALIAAHPGRAARELATLEGRDRDAFKADVRKLKTIGLTESLEVGYRLSPRGRAWLER